MLDELISYPSVCVCVCEIWIDVKPLHVAGFLYFWFPMLSNCTHSVFQCNFFQQGDWSRFAYPVQRSYGKSVDEWSDQPLVPASFSRYGTGLSQEPSTGHFISFRRFISIGSFYTVAAICILFFQMEELDVWTVRTALSELSCKFSQLYGTPVFLGEGLLSFAC